MCRVRPELERLELPPQLLPGLNSGGVRSSSSPGDLIQLLIWLDLHVNIRLHFHDINIIPNISALCHRSLLEYLHKEEKRTAARWQLFAIQDGYTLLRSYSLAYFFFALNILQAEFIQINFWNPINNAPAICGQREGNAILKEQPVPVYYVSKHINPLSGVLSRSKNRQVVYWPRDRTTIVTCFIFVWSYHITPSFYLLETAINTVRTYCVASVTNKHYVSTFSGTLTTTPLKDTYNTESKQE